VLVWSLVVLASLLLIVSMAANWVQREALDTDQVADTTDQILADHDVQQALSIYLVDQLYANVDVTAEIQQELPSNVKALAAPAAAATRQLALNVSQRALASPRVQALVSNAIRSAHRQFVALIRNKGRYVESTGGEVALDYGAVLAEVAARVGVDPDTISKIQAVVRKYTTDLKQGLTTAQSEIKSVRSELAQVQGGTLSTQLRQDLQTLQKDASDLDATVTSLEKSVKSVEGKVPARLRSRLSDLDARLSDLDTRLTNLDGQITAVLKNPSEANVSKLDPSLAAIETRITTLLERQAVQTPGRLVVLKSSQLSGVQSVVRLLRNLGFVLPIAALLLYVGALYLARGWRRQALLAIGGGILTATLLVLLVRRLAGHTVVDSVAGSETVKSAVQSVWDIVSGGLRQRALFVLAIGLGFTVAGWVAGPGRSAVAVRRFLAPYLRDNVVLVYSVVAVLFLLWLAFFPGVGLGQLIVVAALAVLTVVGIEALRRQTVHEFPSGPDGT
jgi:transposase-like protein